jgi:hypothetical protein
MDTAKGENVTKDSGFQVPSSMRPTRERVGYVTNMEELFVQRFYSLCDTCCFIFN